jgi:hypothetical protein
MSKQKENPKQDILDEVEILLKEAEAEEALLETGQRSRGPHEPTSLERKKQRARAIVQQLDQDEKDLLGSEESAPEEVLKNPRLARTSAARDDRRRQKIWKLREKLGIQCRRPIFDKKGKDTGATTSNTHIE